jgi:hypothetical protein
MPLLIKRIARYVREYEWFAVVVEVMVIIIGLMLAFQLDRWREDRVEREQERVYIDRLVDDIQSDIPDIEYAIALQSIRLNFADLLMEVARDPDAEIQHAVVFLGAVDQAAYTYTPTLTAHTFENLRLTGDMRLILDDKVKGAMFEYYGFDEEQRQYRPLQFTTEARHFALAAGILSSEQSVYIQDHFLFFRPHNLEAVKAAEADRSEVAATAKRLSERAELVAWLPYVRSMQLEQIRVHEKRLEHARAVLSALKAYVSAIATD